MSKTIKNIICVLGILAGLVWSAKAPGLQALIPLLPIWGLVMLLVSNNTDWIKKY